MNDFLKIFYLLNALEFYYKSEHWTIEGDDFYSRHLFFDRLGEGINKEKDELAELLIGLKFILGFSKQDFSAKKILEESVKILKSIPDFFSFKEACEIAENLEAQLLQIIKSIPQNTTDIGLYNHFAAIAQNHNKKAYLLNQTLLGN